MFFIFNSVDKAKLNAGFSHFTSYMGADASEVSECSFKIIHPLHR